MNKYEVALVLSAAMTEEKRAEVLDQIKGYIGRYEGTITNTEEWGKKKLAYEIRKENEGYYYFINVDAEPAFAPALEQNLHIMMETVLRYLIVRLDEE